jgi:HEAT repeat protein
MPSYLNTLVRMLRYPEVERRCAAAMVLSELAPRETPVVEALGEVLAEENQQLNAYALEALERIGSRAALPYLLPLLERDEPSRHRAERAIAALGEPAITDVCRELSQAPRERRRPLVTLLVDLDGKGALAAVLEALLFEEPKFVDVVIQRYVTRWSGLSAERRGDRRDALLAFSGRADVRGRTWPTALALRLLGALGDPGTRKFVLGFARVKNPPAVRKAALQALRRLAPGKGKDEGAFDELCAFLEEPDLENVVEPALDALRALPTPPTATAALKHMLTSSHAPVRSFAAERLGDLEDAAAAAALVKSLQSEDPALRELSQDSLRKSPAAPPALVRALLASENGEEAWTLARLVATRASDLSGAHVRSIAEASAAAAKKNDGRAEALLHALRATDPERHRQILLQRGLRLLSHGDAQEAVRALSQLERGAGTDADARYALTVALLKSQPKETSRKARINDRALQLLRGLLAEGDFPLATRLAADRLLTKEDLYQLGVHFAEGEDHERAFGLALLEKVVKASGRSKLAKVAKSKLASARRHSATASRG